MNKEFNAWRVSSFDLSCLQEQAAKLQKILLEKNGNEAGGSHSGGVVHRGNTNKLRKQKLQSLDTEEK